jgi:hypothetical protein
MESPRDERYSYFWLLLPWLTLGAVLIAAAIGVDRWIIANLPFGLGHIAIGNVGWGMLLVLLGSSARWSYLRYWNRAQSRADMIGTVISYAIGISLAQFCVAAGVLYVGIFAFMCAHH